MVEFLLFVLTIGLFAYIRQLSSKLGALEAELDDIRLTFRGPEQSSSPYPAADHQNMPLAAHEAADASPLESLTTMPKNHCSKKCIPLFPTMRQVLERGSSSWSAGVSRFGSVQLHWSSLRFFLSATPSN